MHRENIFHDTMPEKAPANPPADIVPELIAEVYEEMRPLEKKQVLEYLLRPLSLLALAAVAGGRFARLRIRNGEERPHICVEEAQAVSANEIVTLARYVQQANVETTDILVKQMKSLPSMPGWVARLRARPAY